MDELIDLLLEYDGELPVLLDGAPLARVDGTNRRHITLRTDHETHEEEN